MDGESFSSKQSFKDVTHFSIVHINEITVLLFTVGYIADHPLLLL